MVEPDIDQFTLVIQPSEQFDFDEWREIIAQDIIVQFITKSKMHKLFDNFNSSDVKLPEGYTIGYSFNNSPFYFCIAYHEAFIKMGIIVKFSAYAWKEYQKRFEKEFNTSIQLYNFFKLIESDNYTFRLSRIDVCCDYINENIDIAKLKRSIEAGRIEIRYGKY